MAIARDEGAVKVVVEDGGAGVAPALRGRRIPRVVGSNLALRADGVAVMEPDVGPMACGEFGPGRLPEPERIAKEIRRMLAGPARSKSAIDHAANMSWRR